MNDYVIAGAIAAVSIGLAIAIVTWLLVRIPGKAAIAAVLDAEGRTRRLWSRRGGLDYRECAELAEAVMACGAATKEAREKVCRNIWHRYAKEHTNAEAWRQVARCSEAVAEETGEAGQLLVAVDGWKRAARQAGSREEWENDMRRAEAAKEEMERLERKNRVYIAPDVD